MDQPLDENHKSQEEESSSDEFANPDELPEEESTDDEGIPPIAEFELH